MLKGIGDMANMMPKIISTEIHKINVKSVVISNTGAASGIVIIRPIVVVEINVLIGPSVRARFRDITKAKPKKIDDAIP